MSSVSSRARTTDRCGRFSSCVVPSLSCLRTCVPLSVNTCGNRADWFVTAKIPASSAFLADPFPDRTRKTYEEVFCARERGSAVYVTRIYARSQRDDHRTFAAFSRNRASTTEHLRHIEIISRRVVPGILEPARYRLGNDFRRLRGVHETIGSARTARK